MIIVITPVTRSNAILDITMILFRFNFETWLILIAANGQSYMPF